MSTRRAPTPQAAAVSQARWVASHVEIATRDGWTLPLYRLRPVELSSDVPVLMVHGHGTSSWTFFAGPSGGLAAALADSGRDVWAVELRGSRATRYLGGSPRVRVSDKLGIDLPATIDYLRRETGSDLVDGVGHSMGGIMLCLRALYSQASHLRRIVTLGSPLVLDRDILPAALRLGVLHRMAGGLGRLPVSALARRFSGQLDARVLPTHFTRDSVDPETLRSLFTHGVTDVYGAELAELARWVTAGDHRALLPLGLREMHAPLPVPTRFLVGAADGLTTPRAVRRTFESIASEDCDYLSLGTQTGFAQDYRHLDILLGRHAQREVGPLLVDWLGGRRAARRRPWVAAPLQAAARS
jgi:pimeloyl-ACP methyl ester carboxylesterase